MGVTCKTTRTIVLYTVIRYSLTQFNMLYDELFKYMGSIGAYQVFVLIACLQLCVFSVEFTFMIFITPKQDHWCYVKELQNFSFEQQKYIAIPMDDHGNYETCQMHNRSYENISLLELLSRNITYNGVDRDSVLSCESGYVYDRSVFASTAISRVSLPYDV